MDDMQDRMEETVQEEQEMVAAETGNGAAVSPVRKRLPVMVVPALIALAVMLYVFFVTARSSLHQFSIMNGLTDGEYVGLANYGTAVYYTGVFSYVWGSLVTRLLVLVVCGLLAAGMCALYRCMKKPSVVLWVACLWLVPAAVPTAVLAHAGYWFLSSLWVNNNAMVYLLGSGLQTLGLFCFVCGLFAYFRKNPFAGLPVVALVWLLGILTTNAVYPGFTSANFSLRTLEHLNINKLRDLGFDSGNAAVVIKILLQVLVGIIPVAVLVRMMSKDKGTAASGLEKTARWEWLLFPLAVGCFALIFLLQLTFAVDDYWLKRFLNSLILALAGGGFGGIVAWSFVRLLRGSSAPVFGVTSVMLSAAVSSLLVLYLLFMRFAMSNKMASQVLLAAFDWRMIFLMISLGYILRSARESHPLCLVLSLMLLTGAFTWANLIHSLIFEAPYNQTIGSAFINMIKVVKRNPASQTTCTLLTVIPPVILGLGGALLMRRALHQGDGSPGVL